LAAAAAAAAARSPLPLPISPRGLDAIYPRPTGKKLVFIDRLLTANLAISISRGGATTGGSVWRRREQRLAFPRARSSSESCDSSYVMRGTARLAARQHLRLTFRRGRALSTAAGRRRFSFS